ncbi:MAG: phenylalanine--tRNA ligase subunit beta, partial [Muribaculaceae bacterium]|nr:phenylalanine--tRNA ligase subunit beta [Muribaculaceae bacterium]
SVDSYPEPVDTYPVELSLSYLNSLIGKEIPADEVVAILRSLEIGVENVPGNDDLLKLAVPTYRVDVRRPCDVVEEVLRVYGYNNVEYSTTVHSSLQFKTLTDAADDLQRLVSEQLNAQGFNEILNNSLTSKSYYEGLDLYPAEHCVELLNPLSSDLGAMRQTLLFGGLESVAHNVNRKAADLMFYEFGNTYHRDPAAGPTADAPLAPFKERQRLALWMPGNTRAANWARPAEEASFFDLKGAVANILARLGISVGETVLSATEGNNLYDAALTVATRNGQVLGYMGQVSRAILKKADIDRPVYYAELEWASLVKLAAKKKVTFAPLPKTQPVKRDLALLLDSKVSMEQVENAVRQAERKLLRGVELFDVYEGKNLPAGKKSYAIAITLQDFDKTLQDKQIEQSMSRIVASLEKNLGAQLR